jgi:hypothetical protein
MTIYNQHILKSLYFLNCKTEQTLYITNNIFCSFDYRIRMSHKICPPVLFPYGWFEISVWKLQVVLMGCLLRLRAQEFPTSLCDFWSIAPPEWFKPTWPVPLFGPIFIKSSPSMLNYRQLCPSSSWNGLVIQTLWTLEYPSYLKGSDIEILCIGDGGQAFLAYVLYVSGTNQSLPPIVIGAMTFRGKDSCGTSIQLVHNSKIYWGETYTYESLQIYLEVVY